MLFGVFLCTLFFALKLDQHPFDKIYCKISSQSLVVPISQLTTFKFTRSSLSHLRQEPGSYRQIAARK